MADQPTVKTHSWYHDGVMSEKVVWGTEGIGPWATRTVVSDRVCQDCGFRETVVGDIACFGTRVFYNAAYEHGRVQGVKIERQRMSTLLGLR